MSGPDKIRFTVTDDGKALGVGQLFKPPQLPGVVYRVTKAWIDDGIPTYEAERESLNRHELRAKFAKEKK